MIFFYITRVDRTDGQFSRLVGHLGIPSLKKNRGEGEEEEDSRRWKLDWLSAARVILKLSVRALSLSLLTLY